MVAPKPKDVLPLAQEITRLESQLAEAKRKWNLLFGVTEPEKKARKASPDGLTAKIMAYVNLSPGEIASISTIASGIGEDELSVGRALYRLARAGKIVNPSRGMYGIEKEVPSEEKTS